MAVFSRGESPRPDAWTTGLTKPGLEGAYLEVIRENCALAKRFVEPDLIVFAGERQKDVPWESQYRQIVSELRKASDIGGEYDTYICLEPRSTMWNRRR